MNLISFCTPDYYSIFESHLNKSIRQLEDNRIRLYLKEIGKMPWEEATRQKPSIILAYLKELKQDIWYTDVDSELICYPVNGYSKPIGCHFLKHSSWYNNESDVLEPLTGTLYFHYDPISIDFLERWIERCRLKNTDGSAFNDLINTYSDSIQHLPLRYCYINSLPNGDKPNIKCKDPIFIHYQASRKMRKV